MFFKNYLKWCPQVYNESKEKNPNFKVFKVMKSTSKFKISHYPLSTTFNDKF